MVISSRLPFGIPSFNSLWACSEGTVEPVSVASSSRRFFVNFLRIENPLGDDLPIVAGALAKKTAAITFMASGAADLVDLNEDRIVVTVDERVFDFLKVARLLALEPRPFARAAVVMGLAGF